MSPKYEVIWSEVAIRDLEQIVDYIQRDAPMAAQRLFDRIVEQSKSLESFPFRGRVMPELARFEVETLRELLMPPYRLMYSIESDRVRVLAVFDGRRNLEDVILGRVILPKP
jgi:addiction module RelE/StbE family toxin